MHPRRRAASDPPVDVLDSQTGNGVVPAPVQVFRGIAELDGAATSSAICRMPTACSIVKQAALAAVRACWRGQAGMIN